MIAYIGSWQSVLTEMAAKQAFQFNTYIISILAIFYLQMNHGLPKVKDVPHILSTCINVVPNIEKSLLLQAITGFFKFYADRYEINNHLISVTIGRWQQIQLKPHEKNFSAEQKWLDSFLKHQFILPSINLDNIQNFDIYVRFQYA